MNSSDSPFSRPFDVHTLSPAGRSLEIEATEAECEALAKILEISAVRSLTAQLRLDPMGGKGRRVRVVGRLSAVVEQACSVSLVPLETRLDEDVLRVFVDRGSFGAGREPSKIVDVDFSLADDGDPEPFDQGVIDLGHLLSEELAIKLDPFPRAPGVSFDWIPDPD